MYNIIYIIGVKGKIINNFLIIIGFKCFKIRRKKL